MKSNSLKETKHPAIILDTKHNILEYNPAFLEVVDSSTKRIKGRKCYKLLHGASHPPECCPMQNVLLYGDFHTEEMLMESLNEKYLVSCMPIHNEEGHIAQVMHVLQRLQKQV